MKLIIINSIIYWILAFIASIFLITLVLWIVGRSTVGEKKAKLSDAFLITFLGTIISIVFMNFLPSLSLIITLIAWLGLIKHFFDTGWLGALGIAIVSTILIAIIIFILSLLVGLSIPFLIRF